MSDTRDNETNCFARVHRTHLLRVQEMSSKNIMTANVKGATKSAKKSSTKGAPVAQAPVKKDVKAPVIAKAPPESEEVAKTTKERRAEFIDKAQNAGAFITRGAGADALGGAIGRRTHSIHSVLLDAAVTGALLTTKEITGRATEHLGAPCNATASHLNTMKERLLLTRENGAWRLTDAALTLCGATWAQDVEGAPKKKKK